MMRTGNDKPIRTLTFSLLGAAALAAGLLLVRQQRVTDLDTSQQVPAGETQPGTISLERIRAVGY
jgi:hypothetical protein